MKIVFFGSGRFAVSVLKAVHLGGHDVVLVVTQPDRKKGRHLHLAATPVKEFAVQNHLKIFQPQDINKTENARIIKENEADIFLVVSYGRILSGEILSLSKIMSINIHASLLPKYRGAAPINRALMNGEQKTGITFIRMNEQMDRGDIIFQKSMIIDEDDNVLSLEDRLSGLAGDSVNPILENIAHNKIKFKKQNEKQATYASLMKRGDGLILWDKSCEEIFNRFRGCFGWPGSFTIFEGKLLKILDMKIGRKGLLGKPGEFLSAEDNRLEIACLSGSVIIHEVLPESHKKMSVKSFLAGHKIKIGDRLGE